MTCRECLAELSNRVTALKAALTHNGDTGLEFKRLAGGITDKEKHRCGLCLRDVCEATVNAMDAWIDGDFQAVHIWLDTVDNEVGQIMTDRMAQIIMDAGI